MRKYYNQYTGLKYTTDDIIKLAQNYKNMKQFRKTGLDICAKKLNCFEICKQIFIDKKNNEQIIKKQKTKEEIEELIKNYKDFTSFIRSYPQYRYYFYEGQLLNKNDYFIHQKQSTPQLICKKILEIVCKDQCLYNHRRVLDGKELDIFFEKLSLACEYNGFYWHEKRKQQDLYKIQICEKKGISLIVIKEPSLNAYKNISFMVDDIKRQFIDQICIINSVLKNPIESNDILQISIDWETLTETTYGKHQIEYIINNCNRYSEVKTKYNKLYQYLTRHKMLHLLEPIKKRDYIYMNKNEFIEYVINNFSSYSEFVKHKIYKLALKRGLIDDIKSKLKNIM
jgi:hypothetical protein